MCWNVCGNRRVAALLLPAILLGCQSKNQRGDPLQTIVVRDATRPVEPREYDLGDRAPNRIEVVVTDPQGGGGGGDGDGGGGAGQSPLASIIGRSVKVQFRRDALGLSATSNAPIPLTSPGPGGRAVSLTGIVRSARGGWLVIDRETDTYWIPQAAILLIETFDAPTTAPAAG